MPEALYIHRRVITDEESTILQQIHYTLTEEGLVDILKMTAHYLLDDGKLSPSFFGGELTQIMRMSLLSILVEDGVIDIP
jgi:hypothetical protein